MRRILTRVLTLATLIWVTACGVTPQTLPESPATSDSSVSVTESISEAATETTPQLIAEPVSMEAATQPVTDNPPDEIQIGHALSQAVFFSGRISVAREPNSKLFAVQGLSGAVNVSIGDRVCMRRNAGTAICESVATDGSFKIIFEGWEGDQISLSVPGFLNEGLNLLTLTVGVNSDPQPDQNASTSDSVS